MEPLRALSRASFALFVLLPLYALAEPGLLYGQVICASLAAHGLNDAEWSTGSPNTGDTLRLQRALDSCGAGQAVRLSRVRGSGQSDFFSGPLRIPTDVTLQLVPGVKLYLSSPDPGVPMIEAAPGAGIAGPGVIEARAGTAASDLVRSEGALRLVDLTLRAAPGISLHHTTAEPLWLDGVSIVSQRQAQTQPLVLESSATTVTISNSSFAGAESPVFPENATLSRVAVYGGVPGRSPCRLVTPSICLADDLPAILTHLEVSSDRVISAIFTPAELGTAEPTGLVDFALDGVVFASAPISGDAAWAAIPVPSAGLHTLTADTHDGALHLGELRLNGTKPRLESNSTTSLSTTLARVRFGMSVVLRVSVSPAAAIGSVTLTDSGQPLATLALNGGVANFTSNSFAPGTHTIAAEYSGDANDAPSQSPPLTLIVQPDVTTLQLSTLPATAPYGSLPPLDVSITPRAATGLIRLHDLGTSAINEVTLSNGAASFPLRALPIGSHTLSVTYAGDVNDEASASFSLTTVVTLIPTTVALIPIAGSASYGTPILLTAQLSPSGTSGLVTFTDSIVGQLAQLPAGTTVSTTVKNFGVGLHNLIATYSGDATHASATSLAYSVNITPEASSTLFAPIPPNLTTGTPLILTASVLPASATGNVAFRDNTSGILGSVAVSAGIATLTASALLPGTHILSASYAGDANNQPSSSQQQTVTVVLHGTTLQFAALPATFVFGAPVTLSVTTLPATATGTVSFSDGGTVLGLVLLADGLASLTVRQLSLGPHSIAGTYTGDVLNSPAAAPPLSLRIVPDPTVTTLHLAGNPTRAGTPLRLDILVSALWSVPGGTVILRSGASTLTSGVLSNSIQGKGFLTLVLPTTNSPPGTYPISASYLGDPVDSASDSLPANQTFTIIPTPVVGSLNLSANPITAGEPVTVTAALTSSSTPAGTIDFAANGSSFAKVTLDAGGHASATLPALPPGSWVVAASYVPLAPYEATVLAPLVLGVQIPFSVTAAPAGLTLIPAAAGSFSLTVTPLSGFNGPVRIACVPAVSFIHCTPASPNLVLGHNSPATMAIDLAVGATTISHTQLPEPVTFLVALAPLLLFRRKRRRSLFHLTLLCLCLFAGGCGAGYFDTIVPGPYLVSVSASVPGYSASQTITVTVPKGPAQ